MELKVRSLGLFAGRPVAILHKKTAKELNLHVDERIEISSNKGSITSIIDAATGLLKEDEIVLSEEIIRALRLKKSQHVSVAPQVNPRSSYYIREKIKGVELDEKKIYSIISDIVTNKLTEAEIAYFVAAEYINRMSMQEVEGMVKAIVKTGNILKLSNGIIADKHSIGGIAGNRTTPLVVSICAAAGLVMPKTSSRAITSAAGTADVIETLTKVEFSIKDIRRIIKKANACMIWGGALGLAPADDKIIQVERLLNLDPEAQLLASIISKKVAASATHVVLDIPCGKSAKFTVTEGKNLEKKFIKLAGLFNVKIKTIITNGDEPIGNGIGPILEMRDVISILKQEESRPRDLEKKSLLLASHLLELTGKAGKGKGLELAKSILESGKALEKFSQIIECQGGSMNHANRVLKLSRYKKDVRARAAGEILGIDNKKINSIARAAGCPSNKSAGLYLWKHCRDKVKKGDILATLHSENKAKLRHAEKLFHEIEPIGIL